MRYFLQSKTASLTLALALWSLNIAEAAEPTPNTAGAVLHAVHFSQTIYGHTPQGWRDLTEVRPNRNWAVDGNGYLRQLLKNKTGLIVCPAKGPGDLQISAQFKKTEDETVSFGLAGRVQDDRNYYLARFAGNQRLELLLVKEGAPTPLDLVTPVGTNQTRPTGRIALRRYREGERWTLTLALHGNRLEAVVLDQDGHEQARLSAINDQWQSGSAGLCCTRFAAAESFRVESLSPDAQQPIVARQPKAVAKVLDYSVVRPFWKTTELDTPREKLAASYDVVIAGAGTGGWAAAVQAARLGARVLLLEETDWIGGQMSAAAVTTMDEGGVWHKFPVRERGLYREFHESMVLYYQTLDKDPFVTYYSWPDQLEGGYEPKAARAVQYGFIDEIRRRGGVLDLSLRTRVSAVAKQGDAITGATLSFADGSQQNVSSKTLIDATEYGDVIPLTGARYRVGNSTSDNVDPAALVQDHTWTCVVREYPGGVPEELQIKQPPPGYETGSGKRYRKFTSDGAILWGSAGKGVKGARHWSVFFAWRGMADADSPLVGERSNQRHTQCGFNGGNDYPVTAATIESLAQRTIDEREGIYKTLGALYYFQRELGLNWSLAADEGFATAANRAKMKSLNLRPDLEALAVHLPQHPYVRECRRIMGVQTLTAHDLGRFEQARHVRTSVAMGDYFMDLDHGKTAHAIEADLDAGELPTGGGPFQVPFEVFIPEKIDGFLPAEKNISQSRLANGATRLQPITMLTGQAAGTIAALAVKHNVPPRAVQPLQVQRALLDSGCTLAPRWYADVPWGTELWRATQLLALHEIMDRPGEIDRDDKVALGSVARWGVEQPVSADERMQVIARLATVKGGQKGPLALPGPAAAAGEFAIAVARALASADAEPLSDAEKKRLADVELAAKRTPAMRAAAQALSAARQAYTTDRRKFPADRDPAASKTYNAARSAHEAALHKAMLAVDPQIEPLLARQAELVKLGLAGANEGETVADAAVAANDALKPVQDQPGLPRVLLIGDSISIGYTLGVREKLKGKANVHRIPQNGGATEVGLEKMKSWLKGEKWDVIHFNFGLHDAKYASETTQRATREQYAENLRQLIQQMKTTGAKLVFATTTPVPKGGVLSPTRKFDSIEERNKIARRVMEENGVAIDDLYSAVLPHQERVGRSNDVHYQPEGYAILATAVAESIEAQLKKP